jgi:peptidyl-tRNA hydrolase
VKSLPLYSGPDVEDRDVISVHLVLNGSLGMTPGKCASQSFHCGWLLHEAAMHGWLGWARYRSWVRQGRRVVVRVAETEAVFERIERECEGVLQRDEGMTQVEHGAATALVTFPYRRGDTPKVLSHKKAQLYR